MIRIHFGLRLLMWLMAVCAFGSLLLTSPPLVLEKIPLPTGKVMIRAANWPAEIVFRIASCVALFVIPIAVARLNLSLRNRILVGIALASGAALVGFCALIAVVLLDI